MPTYMAHVNIQKQNKPDIPIPLLLLPKYDTQEELLEVWLKELDQTINYLSSNEIKDVLNNQDFIYKGDLKKLGQTGQFFEIENCSPFDKQRPEPCF